MKRLLAFVLLVMILLSMAACNLDKIEIPTNGLPTTQPNSYSSSQVPNYLQLKSVWETFITDMLLSGQGYYAMDFYIFYNGADYYALVDDAVMKVDKSDVDEAASDKIYAGYKVYYSHKGLAEVNTVKARIKNAYTAFVEEKALANDFTYKNIDSYVFQKGDSLYSLSSDDVLKLQTSSSVGKLVYDWDGYIKIYLKK